VTLGRKRQQERKDVAPALTFEGAPRRPNGPFARFRGGGGECGHEIRVAVIWKARTPKGEPVAEIRIPFAVVAE
jgi:hypothetical protein